MSILKIDRSFIRELATDSEYEKIISGIIGLAQSLNLEVVAEGLETAGQCGLLRSVGCDAGQGFYFSKPLTSEASLELLAKDLPW